MTGLSSLPPLVSPFFRWVSRSPPECQTMAGIHGRAPLLLQALENSAAPATKPCKGRYPRERAWTQPLIICFARHLRRRKATNWWCARCPSANGYCYLAGGGRLKIGGVGEWDVCQQPVTYSIFSHGNFGCKASFFTPNLVSGVSSGVESEWALCSAARQQAKQSARGLGASRSATYSDNTNNLPLTFVELKSLVFGFSHCASLTPLVSSVASSFCPFPRIYRPA